MEKEEKSNSNLLPEIHGKMSDAKLQKSKETEAEMAFWSRLQRFTGILNGDVEAEKLQDHPIVKDCKYLPISFMEMSLDEVFFGAWNTDNFKWQVISNEVVGSIDLSVYHPLLKMWIKRTGAAAIQIMVDSIPDKEKTKMSRQEINAWAVSVDNKKPGALSNGGFSKLKAECFKNAALGLGRYFGRDVNREHRADDYLGTIKDPDERKNELRTMISQQLADNQDLEFVQSITKRVLDAEEKGENTLDFYREIIKILKEL
jgi:hypothetical protein